MQRNNSFLKNIIIVDKKMGLLWQYSTQKAVDWQRRISAVNPESRTSWKKSYSVCMVGSQWYYSFWVLKRQSNTQLLQCVYENHQRKLPTLVNRRNIVFLYNNVRTDSARITQEKILDLSWSVLLHLPYSPNLAPSNFHLFHSLQNVLNDKNRSGENIHGKALKPETIWISLERN